MFQGTAQHANAQNITYTKFVDEVNQNQVKAVTMQADAIKGELANGQPFT
ncbi:MAG: ATP-dependent metallopeptidase FtsH/Yme1/Tma family protein, partial [Gemmatimonadales bacterium]